jgi:hypothetical protein
MAPVEEATDYVATLKSLVSTEVHPQTDGQITQIFVKRRPACSEALR